MKAITDMLSSERTVLVLALTIAATVLAAIGIMTVEQWRDMVQYLATLFIGSKTVTSAVEVWKDAKTETAATVAATAAANPTPAMSATIDVRTDASARKPEGGAVRGDVLAILAVVALAMSGCSWAKREGKTIADSIVDCTKGQTASTVRELGPVMDNLLTRSLDASGKVDWTGIRDSTMSFTAGVGGCVLADAVSRALAPKPTDPNAPKLSPLEVDRAQVRDGFRALSVQRFGGQSFRTANGVM